MNQGTHGLLVGACASALFALSGCYTVVHQSQAYYSDFEDGGQAVEEVADSTADQTTEGETEKTVVIHRYYQSPWYAPYPWISFVPGYVAVYDPYWFWSGYPYYDYYWYGCHYPTGYIPPHVPGYPIRHARRNFGLRGSVVHTTWDASSRSSTSRRPVLSNPRYRTAVGASIDNDKQNNLGGNQRVRGGNERRDATRGNSGDRNYRRESGSSRSGETRNADREGQRNYRGGSQGERSSRGSGDSGGSRSERSGRRSR